MKNRIKIYIIVGLIISLSILVITLTKDSINPGEIKSISTFRIDNTGKRKLESLTEYDESGNEIKNERYSFDGTISSSQEMIYQENQEITNTYDKNIGYYSLINSIRNGQVYKSIITSENNNIPSSTIYHTYDDIGNIIEQKTLENKNESITHINYIYDEDKNVIERTQSISSNDSIRSFHTINKYRWNRLILSETTDGSGMFPRMKTIRKYRINGDLKYVIKYKDNRIDQVQKYDRDLVVNIKRYDNNGLALEIKNKYSFDDYNNWIKKEEYDRRNGEYEFQKGETYLREISYY